MDCLAGQYRQELQVGRQCIERDACICNRASSLRSIPAILQKQPEQQQQQ